MPAGRDPEPLGGRDRLGDHMIEQIAGGDRSHQHRQQGLLIEHPPGTVQQMKQRRAQPSSSGTGGDGQIIDQRIDERVEMGGVHSGYRAFTEGAHTGHDQSIRSDSPCRTIEPLGDRSRGLKLTGSGLGAHRIAFELMFDTTPNQGSRAREILEDMGDHSADSVVHCVGHEGVVAASELVDPGVRLATLMWLDDAPPRGGLGAERRNLEMGAEEPGRVVRVRDPDALR